MKIQRPVVGTHTPVGTPETAGSPAKKSAETTVPAQKAQGNEGVTLVERKTVGDLEPNRQTGGSGAKGAVQGLMLVEEQPRSNAMKRGVAAALTGLALVGFGNNALAQTTNSADLLDERPTATAQLPGGSSLLQTQLRQLTRSTQTVNVNASVQQQAEQRAAFAFQNFQTQVESILRLDAAGLSSQARLFGNAPLGGQSTLTPDQQNALERSVRDLVRELPVSSLSPNMIGVIKDAMQARGMSTEGLEARRIKDLGDVAGDIVKDIVSDFRSEKPAAFYSLAVSAAAALGVGAYLEGSDVLKAVGVRPEVKVKFLDDKLQVRAGAEWEAKLSNPTVYVGVNHQFPVTVGGSQLQADVGVRANLTGPTFGQLQTAGFQLSGTLSGELQNGGLLSLGSTANFSGSGSLQSATIAGTYVKDTLTVGASATYISDPNRFVSSLSVGYRPNPNTDIFIQGSHDSRGDSYVGVGVRIGF